MRRCYTYFSHSNFSFNILCFFWTHAELEPKNGGSPSEFGCSSKAADRGDVRWFPHNYFSLLSCKWSLPNSLWHPQLTFTGREVGNPPLRFQKWASGHWLPYRYEISFLTPSLGGTFPGLILQGGMGVSRSWSPYSHPNRTPLARSEYYAIWGRHMSNLCQKLHLFNFF